MDGGVGSLRGPFGSDSKICNFAAVILQAVEYFQDLDIRLFWWERYRYEALGRDGRIQGYE